MSVDEMLRHDPDPGDRAGTRRRGVRGFAYLLLAVALVVLLLAAGVVLVVARLGDQVGRYPSVFAGLDTSARPADTAGTTFLLMGTDSRSPVPTTGSDAGAPDFVFGRQRSDAIMLATIAPGETSASVVSLPRDSWVDVPGHGMNKINAAYSFGGPTLLIATVEALTRVHVDHFAVIDFDGFRSMIDAVGGIEVTLPRATGDGRGDFRAGPQRLDGEQALSYVRERYDLPGGDLDRVRRQQNVLRAVMRTALSSGTLSSPTRAYGFVDSLTRHVGVDDSLSNTDLAALAFSLRDLRSDAVTFTTAPTTGTGTEGDQSVVYLDPVADDALWFAVNNAQVEQWAATRPDAVLGAAPN